MNTRLVASIIGLSLLGLPLAVSAGSAADLSAQVQALLTKISAFQSQGAVSAVGSGGASCVDLTFDGGIGAKGAQVLALQTFLGITPPTGYFGAKTKIALAAWQAAHGISATGYVGPKTRAAMSCTGAVSTRSTTAPTVANTNGQMQTYTNPDYGFTFQYPADVTVQATPVAHGTKVTATVAPHDTSSTVTSSQVLVDVSNDPAIVSMCDTSGLNTAVTLARVVLLTKGITTAPTTGTRTIGGVPFHSVSETVDMKGIFMSFNFYAATHNGRCYILSTSVTGNDPTTQNQLQSSSPVVLPAQAASIMTEEDALVQSLVFAAPAPSPGAN